MSAPLIVRLPEGGVVVVVPSDLVNDMTVIFPLESNDIDPLCHLALVPADFICSICQLPAKSDKDTLEGALTSIEMEVESP